MGSLDAVSGSVGLYHSLFEFSRRGHAGVWLQLDRLSAIRGKGVFTRDHYIAE